MGYVEHMMAGLAIERIARGVELSQSAQRIWDLEQRPPRVMPQSLVKFFWLGTEVDADAVRMKQCSIRFAEHDSAAGGNYCSLQTHRFDQYLRFDLAKSWSQTSASTLVR